MDFIDICLSCFFQPLSTEDYSGAILGYEVTYEHTYGGMEVVSWAANVTRRTLQLPRTVKVLHISAITSSGKSAPADITLTHPGLVILQTLQREFLNKMQMNENLVVLVDWCFPASAVVSM